MTRSVIVEDEAVAARRLRKMVEAEGLEVVDWLPSNQALQTYLSEQAAPDLFFMDIHLAIASGRDAHHFHNSLR